MEQEYLQEAETLKSNLCKTESKFLNEWTGENWKNVLKSKKQQALDSVRHAQENVKSLEESTEHDRDKLAKIDQEKSEETLASLERELGMLSLQTEQLSKKRILREKQLDDAKKHNMKEEQVVTKAREKTMLKLNQFTKGITFFQDYLGFTFKKVDDDHLQFVFKYIDPDNHDAPFMFTVKIDESGTYNIKDCSPVITRLSALTDELNKTNDFSKFVISVRQGFKELVNV